MSRVYAERISVVIVDDDDVFRHYISMVLSELGAITAHEAASGKELGEILARHPVDCIVLDFNLGVETGFGISAQLKTQHQTPPPIVMLTGDGSEATVIKALRLGFRDYVPKRDLDGNELIAVILRAVEQDRQEIAVRAFAMTDGLTGLANRRTFDETLARECRRALRNAAPISLLMVDVDRFKDLNDTLGHQAGDECLRQLARMIGGEVLRPGDFTARYGGEEFAIILPDTVAGGAAVVAGRLMTSVEKLAFAHASSPSGHVTVSIGVACSADLPLNTSEGLIACADAALYRAKYDGRNRIALHAGAGYEAVRIAAPH